MGATAGEEVTHHAVQIRLNHLSLGCVGVFNPNMEICLSRPSLGWIRRLKQQFGRVPEQLLVNCSNNGETRKRVTLILARCVCVFEY